MAMLMLVVFAMSGVLALAGYHIFGLWSLPQSDKSNYINKYCLFSSDCGRHLRSRSVSYCRADDGRVIADGGTE